MTIPLPDLDDRTFKQLVDEVRARIAATCPSWTDLSPHDPGITLVELFAFLTETMLYRLNRLPDKAFVAFLNILGVQRQAPVAATVVLEVRRITDGGSITVPMGTGVVAGSGPGAPVFRTEADVTLAEGQSTATVVARHGDRVEGERLGVGTGGSHQTFVVARRPILRAFAEDDLIVAFAVDASDVPEGAVTREWNNHLYLECVPVWAFSGPQYVPAYVVDRAEGRVTFGPVGPRDMPTTVPPAQAEVLAWYRTGGGDEGNVAAGSLTNWKEPMPGVSVTNPAPAQGGRSLEDLADVLHRGPNEFLTTRRAVTAGDYELLATQSSGAVARAKALTRADAWCYAKPGEVEVTLVPHVPAAARVDGRFSDQVVVAHQTATALQATPAELDQRRPLGTSCVVGWAHYKTVSVRARVVVRREEDRRRVEARVMERLNDVISPIGVRRETFSTEGWRFGQALRRSNVYRLLEQAEPGVQWVERMEFVLDEAPDGRITALAADAYQARTWYAGSGAVLFRSTNDGEGWEPMGRFEDGEVRVVTPYPAGSRPGVVSRPGLVAVATRPTSGATNSVHVSEDLGETWRLLGGLDTAIADLAWTHRGATPELLVATDKGLFELALLPGAAPTPVAVNPADPDQGCYAVDAFTDDRGNWCVAVASQAEQGVFLSREAGQPGSFTLAGLAGEDTRSLAVQLDASGAWLWAGVGEANPDQPGTGAWRARLFETAVQWEPKGTNWRGGTCWGLAFTPARAFAATQNAGVLGLDLTVAESGWEALDVNAGLPLRDMPRFEPVERIAASSTGVLISGGPKGVNRSDGRPDAEDPSVGEGRRWRPVHHRRGDEDVTIPDNWLLCSGQHEIEVVTGRAPRFG